MFATPITPNWPCCCGGEVLLSDIGKRLGTVGGAWSGATVGATAHFKYGQGQESKLGAAIAVDGGGWKADGTVENKQTSSSFQGWPTYGITAGAGVFFETDYEWGKFAEVCSNNEEHAMHWDGASNHQTNTTAPSVNTNNCVHQDAGSYGELNYSSATTYSGACKWVVTSGST